MDKKNNILAVICGPTAVGKTRLALQLARYFHTEIISADSRQCYKEMHIGTAAPDKEELQDIPYHLTGHVSMHQEYNAGMFAKDALALCDKIFQKKNIALLAGGTGLYINALCFGFDKLPQKDEQIRSELEQIYRKNGIAPLQDKIKELDTEYYLKGEIQNPHRLIRAIEVCLLSGVPYSSLKNNKKAVRNFTPLFIGLTLPREELYNKINARVDDMMRKGLLEEARSLYPYKNLKALQTVGYKELFDYFDGKLSYPDAVNKIKQHSRNYAKRQLTWFKNKYKHIKWFKPEETDLIIKHIHTYL